MSRVIELLQQNARQSNAEIAELLGLEEAAVAQEIRALEESGVIIGYSTILDQEKHEPNNVIATIEVRITPERGEGFNDLSIRIANFPQVKSCYLMSGAYDLLVVVEGSDLREVARFVAEKLSTLDGVISTATHFQLKTFKENGLTRSVERETNRLPVSP